MPAEPVRGPHGDALPMGDLWAWERNRDGAFWDAFEGKWTHDLHGASVYPGRHPNGHSLAPEGAPAGCPSGTSAEGWEGWVRLRDVLPSDRWSVPG